MSTRATMIDPERQMLGEVEMVGQDRWEEIHRRAGAGASIRAIARELDVDRKTVRRCLRQTEWKPYQRAARADTLLATHASYLRRRAADVGYSAQVLFQELGGRQYEGSYETVKRFVRPLREMQLYAAVTRTRFETPPGLQSQIDWGQVRVWLGAQRQVRHIFVLTLGYSRRSVYVPCLTEALGDLLDAHELAFTHFGGHTQEHLYDRPRTVCVPRGADGVRWNTTFKAFADFWGFEPRLGPPGVGKTHLAVGLGLKAIEHGYRVLFTTAAAMLTTLTKALGEGRFDDKLKVFTIPRLLIIDEIGYLPIDRQAATLFFQLISRRYERGPMILTSNQSFGSWGDVFGDRVIAAAILDRILHHATTISIRGDSYRLKDKLKSGVVKPTTAGA